MQTFEIAEGVMVKRKPHTEKNVEAFEDARQEYTKDAEENGNWNEWDYWHTLLPYFAEPVNPSVDLSELDKSEIDVVTAEELYYEHFLSRSRRHLLKHLKL